MENKAFKKETLVVFLVIIIAIAFWSGAKYSQWRLANQPIEIIYGEPEASKGVSTPEVVEEKIFVHIAGAVANPGVYTFYPGARVEDALRLATPTEDAEIDKVINRAALIHDGEKLYIPSREEFTTGAVNSNYQGPSAMSGSKVNINRASAKELETLTGIGPTRAQTIIDYRNQNGNFQKIEDIMNVKGIGSAIFENIKDKITVN